MECVNKYKRQRVYTTNAPFYSTRILVKRSWLIKNHNKHKTAMIDSPILWFCNAKSGLLFCPLKVQTRTSQESRAPRINFRSLYVRESQWVYIRIRMYVHPPVYAYIVYNGRDVDEPHITTVIIVFLYKLPHVIPSIRLTCYTLLS